RPGFTARLPSKTMLPPCSPPRALRCAALALLLTLAGARAQTNGITQPTFTAGEVGTVIHQFDHAVVGLQPAFADYQHGRLWIGAGQDSVVGSLPVHTWWNMGNPRTPVLDQRIQM